MMRTIVAGALSLIIAASAQAQEQQPAAVIEALQKLDARVFKADSAEAKLRWDSLKALRDAVNKRDVEAWRTVKTKADWEKMRDERIAKLRASLGNFPDAPKQVKVVTTGKLDGEGFTVENIIYETRPNYFVTANLYVPANTTKPMPGFIVIHSHHNPKTERELQDMGMMWARQGCLVLIPDQIGHGERRQHPFTDAKAYPEAFKVGRQDYYFRYNVNLHLSLINESLMGFMVWDLMRGVDVLYQRPNLDKSKVMVFGSVAGGGDPCAVFAALDKRITAAAPFNFGGPQPETGKLGADAELAFNYMGGGGWESTRGLKLGGRDGFHAWTIVASLAPRGLIYGHEFAWDEKNDPVWTRFNKIWDFYGAKDQLASAKGRGSVKGMSPESTHCNNIGFEHRKPMYPMLKNWFGLPIPEENKKRFEGKDLRCWTDEARAALKPKLAHEVALTMIPDARKDDRPATERWIELLGVPTASKGADLLRNPGQVKPVLEWLPNEPPPMKVAGLYYQRVIVRHPSEPSMAVPMLLARHAGKIDISNVVIGLAQDGKQGFLKNRAETIADLVFNRQVAVCLPDLRGTGETASDGRGRTSGATSYSASLLLHGQTVSGVQAQELALVMNALSSLGYKSMALWGDSFAEPNDPKINFAVPHDAGKMPKQSEPMGGTMALLGGVFGGDRVKAIYVRGGMVSFRSMLDSPFCYFPHDAVIPGVLLQGDTDLLAAANAKRGLRMEALVDGLNRRVDQKALAAAYKSAMFTRPAHNLMVLNEQPASPADVAAWLAGQVKK